MKEFLKEQCCCFTGHREIATEEISRICVALDSKIAELADRGITCFYCGGAEGFDTLAAEAVLRARENNPQIRLHLALPYPKKTKKETESSVRYERIKEQADEVVFVSPQYMRGCMQKRNRYMVEHSSVCVAYLLEGTEKGGTKYTVEYAQKKGLERYDIILYKNPTRLSCGIFVVFVAFLHLHIMQMQYQGAGK